MKGLHYKTVPNCLRRYRRARGLKQRDVAQILELKSTSMISRWEKGVCLPSSRNLLRLALLYRTLVDALFIDLMRSMKEELLKKEEEVLQGRNT